MRQLTQAEAERCALAWGLTLITTGKFIPFGEKKPREVEITPYYSFADERGHQFYAHNIPLDPLFWRPRLEDQLETAMLLLPGEVKMHGLLTCQSAENKKYRVKVVGSDRDHFYDATTPEEALCSAIEALTKEAEK